MLDGDPDVMIWGGELVLRDGVAVGQVTSGAWGETLGGCVGLAYVRHPDGEVLTPDLVRAGEYQVNVGGRLYPAAVSLRPPFRPRGRPDQGPLFIPNGLGIRPRAAYELIEADRAELASSGTGFAQPPETGD